MADGQHPGDAAIVQSRLGGKEYADDDHRNDAVSAPIALPTAAGQAAHRPKQL